MSKQKVTTESVLTDFAAQIVTWFLVLMFVVYPLYMQDGYFLIATSKFLVYRVFSLTTIVLCGAAGIYRLAMWRRDVKDGMAEPFRFTKKVLLSPYFFFLLYLFAAVISFIFSLDKTAGFWAWLSYMTGAFFQITSVLLFLVIQAFYRDKTVIWVAALAGSFVTYIVTLLNRFGIYVINEGVLDDPQFVSTVGQTNHYCGYMIAFVALGLGLFTLYEPDKKYRTPYFILLGIYNTFAYLALWTEGSDSSLIVAAVVFYVILRFAIKDRPHFIRYLISMLIYLLSPIVLYFLMYVIYPGHFLYFQEFDTVNNIIRGGYCVAPAVFIALLLAFEIFRDKKKSSWPMKALLILYYAIGVLVIVAVLAVVVLIILVTNNPEKMGRLSEISFFVFNEGWGENRGINWIGAVTAFFRMPFFRKLIGVGCASYITILNELAADFPGKYDLFNVAHNDYLNTLIENGLFGVITLVGFYITSAIALFKKADKNHIAAIALAALAAYAVNLIVSFQTIVSTPYIYMFIAIALAVTRDTADKK